MFYPTSLCSVIIIVHADCVSLNRFLEVGVQNIFRLWCIRSDLHLNRLYKLDYQKQCMSFLPLLQIWLFFKSWFNRKISYFFLFCMSEEFSIFLSLPTPSDSKKFMPGTLFHHIYMTCFHIHQDCVTTK